MRKHTPSALFERMLSAALCALALVGCAPAGGSAGTAGPREPWTAVHTRPVVAAELEDDEHGELASTSLYLLLDLVPTEDSVDGTMVWFDEAGQIGGGLATVTGSIDGSRVSLEDGSVTLGANNTLRWSELRLTLRDSDGDGIADSGTGRAAGTLELWWGDQGFTSSFTGNVDAGPDELDLQVDLQPSDPEPACTILESGGFQILFNKPVSWEEVQSEVAVLAGGEPLAGTAEPVDRADEWVMGLTFRPSARLAFATEVALDTGAITDRLGNAATSVGEPLRTPDDPGPLTGNPGFENGLANWLVEGDVSTSGTYYETVEPASGQSQVIIASYGSIAGYIDVPADASQLSFSATVLTAAANEWSWPEVYVWLNADGEEVQVLDLPEEMPAPCDCGEFGGVIRLPRVEVDLAPYRDLRVFVTAISLIGWDVTPYYSALVLDDFQVE